MLLDLDIEAQILYLSTRLMESVMFCLLLNAELEKRFIFRLFSIAVVLSFMVLQTAKTLLPEFSPVISLILNILPDYLIICIYYKDGFQRKALYTAVFYALMFVCDAISYLTGTAIGVMELAPINEAQSVPYFVSMLSRVFLPVITLVYLKTIRSRKIDKAIRPALILPLPMLLCAFIVAFNPWGTPRNLYHTAPLTFYFIFISLAVSFVLFSLALIRNIAREARHKKLLQYQAEKYKIVYEEYTRLQAAYHDFNNILDFLSATENPNDNIENVRQRLAGSFIQTGNNDIDTILFAKSKAMEKEGLSLVVDGVLQGDTRWLDPIDMTVILGNALDNAIEAVSRLEPEQREPISIKFTTKGHGVVVIQVINRTSTDEMSIRGSPIKSTKAEPGHGHGLKNIQNIAFIYDGYMEYGARDGYFTLSVLLQEPLNTKEESEQNGY